MDYRLIKASKISCFLNGDGKANLLHTNGLAPFYSEDYIGKLHSDTSKQDNQQFDILIANPPYSVKAFKPTVKDGDKLFELFANLSENSSEIECLFVERAKQLIKEGGYAGIVLPVSLLTNDKIYIKTREIILKYFDIKGILALQDNAFMATGTKTIILFMQRRSNTYWEQINFAVKTFFDNFRNVTVAGIEKAFSKFVEMNYEDLEFEDYVSVLKNSPTETAKQSEFYEEHKGLSYDALKALEQDKMLYFFLAYNSKLVLANSGEKTEEKQFLGYEFSNRRGQEGINIYKDDEGHINSCLFSDIDNLDNEKLNSFVYRNFINENIEKQILNINLSEEHLLKNHIDYCHLSELIDFSLPKFEKVINLNSKKKLRFESKYKCMKLKRVDELKIEKGTSITEKETAPGEIPVIAGGTSPAYYHNKANRTANIITISASGANAGFVNYFDIPIWASDCSTITSTNLNKVNVKYIYELLKSKQNDIYYSQKGKSQPHVYPDDIGEYKLPFPDIYIQEKIVEEINKYEVILNDNSNSIKKINQNIKNLMTTSASEEKLGKYTILLKRGKSPKYAYNSDIQIIKSGQIRGLREFDFRKKYYANNSINVDDRLLRKGDLLINSTGVGTAGRINIFELDAKCFVDSHVTICRLKSEELLPLYALYQLYFKVGFKNIEKMATGQSGQIELAPDTIANIRIPVPNIEEQKKIVSKVLPLEAEIEKLQKELDEIPARKQAILDKYLK